MNNHDRYDNDILKAFKSIANSLEKIEKGILLQSKTIDKFRDSVSLLRTKNEEDTLPNGRTRSDISIKEED